MVDEEPVLEVLAGVGEVQPEQLASPPGPSYSTEVFMPDQVAAEGDRHVPKVRVAPDPGVLVAVVHGVVGPVLDRDDGQLGAVADDDLDVVGQRGRPLEPQHHGRLAVRLRDHHGVAWRRRRSAPVPVSVISAGSSTTVSSGTVTVSVSVAACQARALTRSLGT